MQKLLVLIIVLVLMMGCGSKESVSNLTPVKKPESSMASVSKAAVAPLSIREFGDQIITPKVLRLSKGEHSSSVLQSFLQEVLKKIEERYKTKSLNISLNAEGNPQSDMISMASCGGEDGIPAIEVVVPYYYVIYNLWQQEVVPVHMLETKLDNAVTIGFCHELLHLAYTPNNVCGMIASREEQVKDEAYIWYLTCERVIIPLWEANSPLDASDSMYLESWLKFKDQPEDWEQFIREAYSKAY